jgi:hypothetical protein
MFLFRPCFKIDSSYILGTILVCSSSESISNKISRNGNPSFFFCIIPSGFYAHCSAQSVFSRSPMIATWIIILTLVNLHCSTWTAFDSGISFFFLRQFSFWIKYIVYILCQIFVVTFLSQFPLLGFSSKTLSFINLFILLVIIVTNEFLFEIPDLYTFA